jgi:RNA polymerase sigma-70 factor (ECF subfamily)
VAWGGLTYEQVAVATGAPLGTVQSRVSRARRKLRQALGDLDPAALGTGPGQQPRKPRHSEQARSTEETCHE